MTNPIQYRCLYCDIWLPKDHAVNHIKKVHDVKQPEPKETFTVVVLG